MFLKVTNTSELSLPEGIGRKMPIIAGKTLIKVGGDGVKISVINILRDSKNSTCLLGHEKPVSCLSLSPNGSFYLCSCSEDRVILWNLFPFKYVPKETPSIETGLVVGENIGNVSCCSFSWSLQWLVLCLEKELWIVLLRENVFKQGLEDGFSLHKILSTDSKLINMCSFSCQYPDIFVTVEDSNHFKVWNVASCEVIYRSATVINNAINCCSFSGMPNKLLIGTCKGVACVYGVDEKFWPSSFLTLSLSEDNFLQHSKEDNDFVTKLDDNSLVKQECVIFYMKIYNRNTLSDESSMSVPQDDSQHVAQKMIRSIICPGSILLICCNLGIILYDCKSSEKVCSLSFLESEVMKVIPNDKINSIDNIVQEGESLDELECWIKTCSPGSKLYHVNLTLKESPVQNFDSEKIGAISYTTMGCPFEESGLSFLPSDPISKKSPLLYSMKPFSKSMHALGQINIPKKNDKVKSSGYGTAPSRTMFVPITNESKKLTKLAKARKSISLHEGQKCCNEGNILNYGPPEKLVKNIQICETYGTSIKLAYSVNGHHIACNSTPKELCVLPANTMSMEKSITIPGHNSFVTSLAFNLNSKWLLSSSTDSSIKLWKWRNRQCILKISTEPKVTSRSNHHHTMNPVTQAGFFYLDKFIVAASKGQMQLYSYALNESSSVHSWSETGASHKIKTIDFDTQHVNCFSAANGFHTYLVLAGCSNRSVMVYDLNHQKMATILKDAHAHNPPHYLVQQTGSVCPSVPALAPEAYNLFLSAAMCDGVKLWDLRISRCVQKYNQHVNRMYSLGLDFSPCSRFVAVCSEDKKVYLYDTRNCENFLGLLKGFSDVPMAVVFSPCMTQLVVSSLNGHLFTFTHKAIQLGSGSHVMGYIAH